MMNISFDSMFNLLAPTMMELSSAIFFALGFALCRVEVFRRPSKASAMRKSMSLQTRSCKAIEAEVSAGNMAAAVQAWRAVKSKAPTQLETLKLVVEAILKVDPSKLVQEITGHMAAHSDTLCNSWTAAAVLNIVACAGQVTLMEDLHRIFCDRFQIQPSAQFYEVLLGGYASVGGETQVAEICSKLRTNHQKVSARGHSLIIKGFLKNGKVDATLKQIFEMKSVGFTVPSLAVTHLLRAACEVGQGLEIFDSIAAQIPVPPEAIAILLNDCLKRRNLSQARHVEQVARKEQEGSSPLLMGAYDALLKNCVLHRDLYALQLFEEMQKSNIHISDRLCANLLSRCAETKFLRFAEEITKFVRGRDGMTMAVYSALMKVYAYVGMYDKACDLYEEIISQGMEPDSIMYGCLMKFAVQCGRTELSRELFSKVPNLDIQNYMSMIRAAGHDKDIERAFEILQKMKESDVKLDIAVYNCVLDVCVTCGDLPRARELMQEMRTMGLDIIAYNTFLKGFCSLGDFSGAKELLAEMAGTGMPPNDVSFNCLINAEVSRGLWPEAWKTVEMMERSGVQPDRYTVSIIMKALKRAKDFKHVDRGLAWLDHLGLDVCSDEVLLNAVLETCIRHRQLQRLEMVLDAFSKSTIQPTVYTYASLVKAYGALKRLERCWHLWHQMTNDSGLDPNAIALGCMLDALVGNGCTEEAVTLLKKWQAKVPANTIMFATLIKGFANSRQASRAMDMWREMQELKVSITTVVYNAVIDAQARSGLMDEVGTLVQSMELHGCTPDSITYSLIVKGYCFEGNIDKAFEVLRGMQQNQMVKDGAIYNTLLDGCVRNHRMDLADSLLEDMEQFNIIPSNFTLGILVKMYGRRKQLQKAFELCEDLPKRHGFKANAQVKTCLMSACLINHDPSSALKVFDELRNSDKAADCRAYTSMIFGMLNHGWVEQAVVLVEEAYGLTPGANGKALSPGQSLQMDSLEKLLQALEQRGQIKSVGLPLLQRLHSAGVPISGKLLSMFS